MHSRKSLASFTGLLLGAGVFALASAGPAAASLVLVSPPTISGVAQVGQTLTVTNAVWIDPDSQVQVGPSDHHWVRCTGPSVSDCTAIQDSHGYYENGNSYVVQPDDLGLTLRVYNSITLSGTTYVEETDPTAVVSAAGPGTGTGTGPGTGAPAPVDTALPKIVGKTRVGKKLKATTGTWTGTAPITYAYRWFRCDKKKSAKKCRPIKKATKTSYKLTKRDAGHRLRFNVVASNSAGKNAATTEPTAVINA